MSGATPQNFLGLVNRLALESGVSTSAATVSQVTGNSGMAQRFVNWTRDAHREIQNRYHNWRWMRSTFSLQTVIGDAVYAGTDCTDTRLSLPVDRFKDWIFFDDEGASNIKCFLTSGGVSGERWMTSLPWAYFIAIYRRGTQNNGPIVHCSQDPQQNLVIGPKPDAIYTVRGEYQMSTLEFASPNDVPEWPADYHDLVWQQALLKYGMFSGAAECITRSRIEGGRTMRQLEKNQLPQIHMGSPLA